MRILRYDLDFLPIWWADLVLSGLSNHSFGMLQVIKEFFNHNSSIAGQRKRYILLVVPQAAHTHLSFGPIPINSTAISKEKCQVLMGMGEHVDLFFSEIALGLYVTTLHAKCSYGNFSLKW